MQTVGLNHWLVALCFAVQLSECCFGKFTTCVPSFKKKQIPSMTTTLLSFTLLKR